MGKRLEDWPLEDFIKLYKIVRFDPEARGGKGEWKNVIEASQVFDVHRDTITNAIDLAQKRWGGPPPPKAKLVQPKWVAKYEDTELYKKLLKDYPDPRDPSKLDSSGRRIANAGIDLYLHHKETDPTTLSLEAFEEAFKWDIYVNEEILKKQKIRQPTFEKASCLRVIMTYAGFDPRAYKWASTKGLKNPPKRVYLEENELIKYIYGINEPDTLVLTRIGFEGGGRFSATSMIGTEDIYYDLNQIKLIETKTDTFPIKPLRPCTMAFIRRYTQDFSITGKLFGFDYGVYENRFLEAGQRAGIWRYKTDEKGNILYEESIKRVKGKEVKYREAVVEGKKTTSHLMKHTFVSLASLHGVSLESIGDITATDIGTLQEWYMGTGRKKTLSEIQGEVEYIPWWDWIDGYTDKEGKWHDGMDKHWVTRYNELMKDKERWAKVDGIKAKVEVKPKPEAKPEKPKERKPFSFKDEKMMKAIKSIVESKPTTEKGKRLKAYWTKVLELHQKYPELTYSQVKEKLLKS